METLMDTLKQMPYNLEAEQSVLGAILIDPNCISDVLEIVKPSHFYIPQHREIFEIMLEMYNTNDPVDLVTVLDKVKIRGIYDDLSGKAYLFQLAEMVPTSQNVTSYAQIVSEKSYLRQLIEASADITALCYEEALEAKDIVDAAEQKIYDIAKDRTNTAFYSINQGIMDQIERLNKLSGDDRESLLGIPTGYLDLDRLLTGLNKSDLLILASRPGMGKTSFALNISQNVALKAGKKVAIFSLEMSKEQLVERILSSHSRVENHKIKIGDLNENDWEKLAQASGELSSCPILIDDSGGITVSQMKAKLRRVKDLGLVVIDYLQLMTSGKRSDNRVTEISEISRSLKLMAKDLNVPVLTLSQLSRGPESRRGEDKKPMLSDLRESGAIEQDADIVMFLYREDYYNPATERHNICDCIVAKNRHGATHPGVELEWEGEYTSFHSLRKD